MRQLLSGRRWTAIALATLAVFVLAASSGSPAARAGRPRPNPLGGNLLSNPGAEAGAASDDGSVVAVPNWKTFGGFTAVEYGSDGFPGTDEADHMKGGSNFLAGGGEADTSRAIQKIDVSKWSDLIDRKRLRLKAKLWQAGYEDQADNGQLRVQFLNDKGKLVGTMRLRKVAGTDFEFERVQGIKDVPAGTRSVRVLLIANRVTGSFADAYFDNIEVKLIRRTIQG